MEGGDGRGELELTFRSFWQDDPGTESRLLRRRPTEIASRAMSIRRFVCLFGLQSRTRPDFRLFPTGLLSPPPLRLNSSQLRQSLLLDCSWFRHGRWFCRFFVSVEPSFPNSTHATPFEARKLTFLLSLSFPFASSLLPYEDCDTFVSTDAGVTWTMAFEDASKYEFGDQGSILVAVNDEEQTDFVSYSRNAGKTW